MAIFVDSKLQVHTRKAVRKASGALRLNIWGGGADPGKADVILRNLGILRVHKPFRRMVHGECGYGGDAGSSAFHTHLTQERSSVLLINQSKG